jgi:hypothetical protein
MQMLARYAVTGIRHGDGHSRGNAALAGHEPRTDADLAVGAAILDRVVDQVLEDLLELVGVAGDRRQACSDVDRDGDATGASASTTRATIGSTSTGSVGTACSLASIRDSESRSETSRVIRRASPSMISRKRRRAGSSSRAGPSSVSMNPDSEASGVRSSWLTLATKSARSLSAFRSAVTSL